MKRIILHWTGGAYAASKLDKKHYHFIVEGTGRVVHGDLPPEANETTSTVYAAHTRGLNTGSIGVAVAAMYGAVERPFNAGKYPITDRQVGAMVRLVADLCAQYDITVTPQTVLTHAEVEGNLGVKQRGKWDTNWLPGMMQAAYPTDAGDMLRQKIRDAQKPEKPQSPFAAIGKFFAALLKGAKK